MSINLLRLIAAGFLLAAALPAQDSEPVLMMTDAYCGRPGGVCMLDGSLTVKFTNLGAWIDSQKIADTSMILLALDGRVINGLPVWRSGDNELQFSLKRVSFSGPNGADNRAVWKDILSVARQQNHLFHVSVGTAGKMSYSGDRTIRAQVFPSYAWVSAVFLAALFIVFVVLAKKSNIIRDPGPTPPPGKELPYSLARAQMAWWLFLILGSYHYIGLVTGDWDSLTQSVLILAGISAATGLGAVVIDGGKRDQRANLEGERDTLIAAITKLETAVAVQPPPPDLDNLKAQLTSKQNRLLEVLTSWKGLPGGTSWTSDGFLKDILRDDTGVSFHRFQLATWTGVLGFVFVISVVGDLAMPEFSATLLGLMGISSGTYIGFKIPDPPK
jgi:hypothetical protein